MSASGREHDPDHRNDGYQFTNEPCKGRLRDWRDAEEAKISSVSICTKRLATQSHGTRATKHCEFVQPPSCPGREGACLEQTNRSKPKPGQDHDRTNVCDLSSESRDQHLVWFRRWYNRFGQWQTSLAQLSRQRSITLCSCDFRRLRSDLQSASKRGELHNDCSPSHYNSASGSRTAV